MGLNRSTCVGAFFLLLFGFDAVDVTIDPSSTKQRLVFGFDGTASRSFEFPDGFSEELKGLAVPFGAGLRSMGMVETNLGTERTGAGSFGAG